MSWAVKQAALAAWVSAAADLSAANVIWADQRVDRPVPPTTWAELRLGAMGAVGIADALVQLDVEEDLEEVPVAGEEIELRAVGHRESSLTVQVFGPAHGVASARAVAEAIQQALELPGVIAALDTAGVSVFDRGSITSVPQVLETDWEGRCVLTVRLYTIAEAHERTGYITTAHIDLTEQDVEFDAPE